MTGRPGGISAPSAFTARQPKSTYPRSFRDHHRSRDERCAPGGVGGGRVHDKDLSKEDFEKVQATRRIEVVKYPVHGKRAHDSRKR